MSSNPSPPVETKQIPRDQWQAYFDRFTRQYLKEKQPETATVEMVSPTLGDQFDVEGVRLLGLGYDPETDLFELQLEDMEHMVFAPAEIWVMEGEGGFISTVEVVLSDGTNEIIALRKSGSFAPRDDVPVWPS